MVGGGVPYHHDQRRYGHEHTAFIKSTMILKRQRSEEEKLRRHLHGDKGAKFSGGKVPCVDGGGIIGAMTTMMTKDILLLELYDEREC